LCVVKCTDADGRREYEERERERGGVRDRIDCNHTKRGK